MGKAAGVKRRRRKKTAGTVKKKHAQIKHRQKNQLKGQDVEKALKMDWDPAKSQSENYRSMGLCLNPNQTIGKPSEKKKRKKRSQKLSQVVTSLQEAAKRSDQPRNVRFSIPEQQWITKMLDRHGEDCCAISKDRDNLDQLTPSQIKNKIKLFKAAVDQWTQYLKGRGLLEQGMEQNVSAMDAD